ncbi:histidine triad nucleotide-binding protein [candidate division KSB1 bacterium]|nr:MAG: histidine triad nucleotide-binding protein [candidate division KSB1 bacterium]
MSECIFCKIIARAIPATIVRETDDILAFRDVNPQAPQHILIVPKRHIEKLADLDDSDAALMGRMLIEISKLAHELDMETQGYRLVLNNGSDAGQSVWHIHAHLMSGRPFRWPPG